MPTREETGLPPKRHAERQTEQRNPRTTTLDRVSIREALSLLHAEDRLACDAVEKAAPQVAKAIEFVVSAFRAGGRLIYIGAGTSGRLGVLDASEQPPTFGVPPEMVQGIIAGGDGALRTSVEGAEDRAEEGAEEIEKLDVSSRDVVMGITTGGRAPYVLAGLRRARELGAKTVLLSCTPPLEGEENLADCQIHALTGPEPITGSTRMKAGTATKLILNQITTIAMVQMGKVYENLMVDLKPTNEKLVDRAVRILVEVTKLKMDEARAVLNASGNDLKVALVMALAGCDAASAKHTIEKEDGHVAKAIRLMKHG